MNLGKEEWEKEEFARIQLPLRVPCAFSLRGWQLMGWGKHLLPGWAELPVVGEKVVNDQCSQDGHMGN